MVDKGHCKMKLEPGQDMIEFADFYDYRSSYPEGDQPMDEEAEVEENVLEVNSDLELILPSGATIGHRSLKVFYKQNLHEKKEGDPVSLKQVKGSMSGRHLMHQYQTLGHDSSISPALLIKKAKDQQFLHKKWMKLGVKANKLQKHFRPQVDF
jgi:pre-60S factor REI1